MENIIKRFKIIVLLIIAFCLGSINTFAQLKLSQLPFINVWDTGSYSVGVELGGGVGTDYLFKVPYIAKPDTDVFGFCSYANIVMDTFYDVTVHSAGHFGVYDTLGNNYINIDIPDKQYAMGDAYAGIALSGISQTFGITGDGTITDNTDFTVTDGTQNYLDLNSGIKRYFMGDNISWLSLGDTRDTLTGDLSIIQHSDFNVQNGGYLHLDINPSVKKYFIGDNGSNIMVNSGLNQIAFTTPDLYFTDGASAHIDFNSSLHRYWLGDALVSLSLNDVAGGRDTLRGDFSVLENADMNVTYGGVPRLDINGSSGHYSIGDNTTNMTISGTSNTVTLNSSYLNFKALSGSGVGFVSADNSGNLYTGAMGTVASRDIMGITGSVPGVVSYTLPNTATVVCQVGGYITIASPGAAVNFQVNYTDENGTAQSVDFSSVATNLAGSGTISMTAAGAYQVQTGTIRCKASSVVTVNFSNTGAHYDGGAWIFLVHQ